MLHDNPLTTAAIQAAFSEEITAMGGTVKDVFNDGERLFARSILTRTREVVPRDRVQDGVALRATEGEICVHPYTFRQVCSNGAIIVQSVQSRRIEDLGFLDPDEAESAVREAVRLLRRGELRGLRRRDAFGERGAGRSLAGEPDAHALPAAAAGRPPDPGCYLGTVHQGCGLFAIRPDERRDLGGSRHDRSRPALAAGGARRRHPGGA